MEKNAEINFATIFETHDQKKAQTLNLLFFFNEIMFSRAKTSKYSWSSFQGRLIPSIHGRPMLAKLCYAKIYNIKFTHTKT